MNGVSYAGTYISLWAYTNKDALTPEKKCRTHGRKGFCNSLLWLLRLSPWCDVWVDAGSSHSEGTSQRNINRSLTCLKFVHSCFVYCVVCLPNKRRRPSLPSFDKIQHPFFFLTNKVTGVCMMRAKAHGPCSSEILPPNYWFVTHSHLLWECHPLIVA